MAQGREPRLAAVGGGSIARSRSSFLNPSLRTRASMELAAARLWARTSVTLHARQRARGAWSGATACRWTATAAEHVREAFGVLEPLRRRDRGPHVRNSLTDHAADHADDRAFRVHRGRVRACPSINLESARWHPCQALADASALCDTLGDPRGKKLVLHWAPHPKPLPRAVPNSAVTMAARLGMEVIVARPPGFGLDADVLEIARESARKTGGSVVESEDSNAALAGAHAVYAKAWSGDAVYDDPDREAEQRAAHADWQITEAKMLRTARAAFMHCLPIRRGVVASADVLDGDTAIHLLQAEYRLHAQKAILEWVFSGSGFGVPGLSSGAPESASNS